MISRLAIAALLALSAAPHSVVADVALAPEEASSENPMDGSVSDEGTTQSGSSVPEQSGSAPSGAPPPATEDVAAAEGPAAAAAPVSAPAVTKKDPANPVRFQQQ
jgi:hypothetical protein